MKEFCNFPSCISKSMIWQSTGDLVEKYENIKDVEYKFLIIIYSADRSSIFYKQNVVFTFTNYSKELLKITPQDEKFLMARNPIISLMDQTMYPSYGSKSPLMLELLDEGSLRIPITFKKSDIIENRKLDISIPLMSRELKVYVDQTRM